MKIKKSLPKAKILLRNIGIGLLCLLIIGAGVGYQYLSPLTVRAEDSVGSGFLDDLPKTTTITDRNGEVLYYAYKDENRLVVPGKALPESLKKAVVAAEDERFYMHNGFDAASAFRALTANMTNGKIVSGGSTLTMQIIKNVTGEDDPTWQRKVKEAYLATVLEQQHSKEDLLTFYLNMIPLGGNVAGAATASQFYLGKPVDQLTLSESAAIAALITSPNHYLNNHEALNTRRKYVLNRMVATHKIKQEEADAAAKEEVTFEVRDTPYKAPHFTTLVLDELKKTYGEEYSKKGMTVKTTLDLPTQQLAEQSITDNARVLQNVRGDTAGMVVTDPKTGDVLAMVGSPNYFNEKKGQVNVTTAPLSYGSTLKPLIYAMLMEKDHWSPGAIMWDVKTDFPLVGQKPYTPFDYDRKFFGPMTLREALATSRNVTAVKALQMVGLESALNKLQEMGVTSLGTDRSKYGPSLAVGGGGIPLVQMTSAYTALANGGQANPAQYFLEITDATGKVLKQREAVNKQTLRSEVAYEIADILQDNNARKRVFGTNSALVIPGKTVAAKTGTSEDYRSALTIGFTPNVVVGVIVANNDYSPLTSGAGGAMAAAPFFNTFMTKYLADKPNVWYTRPDSVKDTEFRTVLGTVKDLTAPWQSPTDRFFKRIAETDDPLWNRAVAAASKPVEKKEEGQPAPTSTTTTTTTVQTTEQVVTQESNNGNGRGEQRGQGRN
jgi:penicillin-binding protein 1C